MYKILIVEDEFLSREGIKSIIKENLEYKIEILEAQNGIEAKQIIDTHDLDTILLDINIPGIDGIDLCRYIKSKYLECNIIVITAYDDLLIKNKIIDLNVNKYLVKPVRPNNLTYILKKIINKSNKISIVRMEKDNSNKSNVNKLDEGSYNVYIKEILNYIEKNINKNITLEDAAAFVNLSPHYLSKIFKKETKVNFITYLTNRRIDIAKEMLEDESIPISNIAIDLSYSKSNYFSKVFKKKVGLTPSEYREKILSGVPQND